MTIHAIINAAERLFARYGIDGVSMRRLGAEAGAANHYSVQYHFGDKAALVRAVLDRRLPAIEARRGELLSQAVSDGHVADPYHLLRSLLVPLSEQVDDEGLHRYAALAIHIYWHYDMPADWLTSEDFAPMSKHIIQLLIASADLPESVARRRIRLAFVTYLHAVVELDRPGIAWPHPASRERLLDDTIRMAARAFALPLAPEAMAAGAPAPRRANARNGGEP